MEREPLFESKAEKILSREEVLPKLLEYANTTEYEVVGEGHDPIGLTLLEIEIKDPNSDGFLLISYARKKEADEYGRGSNETVIHYATRDADHYEDGGGSSIAKYRDDEWVMTTLAPWLQ
ncbi:hypothetical protein H6788_02735 [Candidatus Nomurabacteria bacterium]|nr:hypothetical protein [Candidatus Nomurabacteria bacterium]MCB9819284.1 hypothetical protein [Candidatus Nomurabacteria bacterium]